MGVKLNLFVFFVSLYLLTAGGHTYSSDEETYFILTKNLVERQSFRLYIAEEGYYALTLGKDNATYIIYNPGQSFLAIPFFMVGKAVARLYPEHYANFILRLFSSFTNAIIGALGIVLFYALAKRWYKKRTSIILSIVFGVSTIWWAYSKTFFNNLAVGFFLLAAYWALVCYQRAYEKRYLLFTAFFLFWAVFMRPEIILAVPLYIAYFFFGYKAIPEQKRVAHVRFFLLSCVGVFFVYGMYTLSIYGNFFKSGYTNLTDIGFNTPLWYGLVGVFFGFGRSILLFSPPIILFFFCFRDFLKWKRNDALFIGALVGLFIVLYAQWVTWHGANSWGIRYLMPFVPFFLLPLGLQLEKGTVRFKRVFCILAVIGFFVQLSSLPVYFNVYYDFALNELDAMGKLPLYEYADPNPYYFQTINFHPYYSPLIGVYRLIPDALKDFVLRWSSSAYRAQHPFPGVPSSPMDLYSWFDGKLDFWWAWWLLSGLPKGFVVGVLFLVGFVGYSGRRIWFDYWAEND